MLYELELQALWQGHGRDSANGIYHYLCGVNIWGVQLACMGTQNATWQLKQRIFAFKELTV